MAGSLATLSGLLALVTAALFAGAAIYINVAEHPARLTLDDRAALEQWRPAYVRGFAMQASLALASALFGLLAYYFLRDWRWFAGAVTIFANWPYTTFVILPVNKRLQAVEAGDAESRRLLVLWGRLHAVRSLAGAVATAIYVWALT